MACIEMSLEKCEEELYTELDLFKKAVTDGEKEYHYKKFKFLEGHIKNVRMKEQNGGDSKYANPDWIAKRKSFNSYYDTRVQTPKEKADLLELIDSVKVAG